MQGHTRDHQEAEGVRGKLNGCSHGKKEMKQDKQVKQASDWQYEYVGGFWVIPGMLPGELFTISRN